MGGDNWQIHFEDLRPRLDVVLEHWRLVRIGILGVLILYLFAYVVYARYFHPLSHINGPFFASVSRLWMVDSVWSGEMHHRYVDQCNKYGGIFRAGPNHVFLSGPAHIKTIYGTNLRYKKSVWYTAFNPLPNEPMSFSARDPIYHTQLRKHMTPGYSGTYIASVEYKVDERIRELLYKIRTSYARYEKPCNMADLIQYYTFDVISELAFGEKFGFMERESDINGYIASGQESQPVLNMFGVLPDVLAFMNTKFIYNLVAPKPTDKSGFGHMVGVAHKLVSERYEKGNKKNKNDMLQMFIEAGMSKQEVTFESLGPLLAGSDSTSTAIRMTMLYVMTNPRAYKKLQDAIDSAIISDVIQNTEARSIPYLDAVVRESIRMFPPQGSVGERIVPEGGETLDGVFIPAGTIVAIPHWAPMKNKSFWGEDADIWKPERWLEVQSERRSEMERVTDFAFGGGRHTCIGKGIAMMETYKTIGELFRRFDLSLHDPLHPMDSKCHGFFIQKNFIVLIRERYN